MNIDVGKALICFSQFFKREVFGMSGVGLFKPGIEARLVLGMGHRDGLHEVGDLAKVPTDEMGKT